LRGCAAHDDGERAQHAFELVVRRLVLGQNRIEALSTFSSKG